MVASVSPPSYEDRSMSQYSTQSTCRGTPIYSYNLFIDPVTVDQHTLMHRVRVNSISIYLSR